MGLLVTLRYVAFFLIYSMTSSLLIQLRILTVLSHIINKAFNSSELPCAVKCDTSMTFSRIQCAGLIHKLKFYGILGQLFI